LVGNERPIVVSGGGTTKKWRVARRFGSALRNTRSLLLLLEPVILSGALGNIFPYILVLVVRAVNMAWARRVGCYMGVFAAGATNRASLVRRDTEFDLFDVTICCPGLLR
jgi:hypothetical protein